jgi:7,8-dihydropterin-6-yl-methyl-4-(beta-D-ribofuranosyl)aminobenzene 5'-phosphate synthase
MAQPSFILEPVDAVTVTVLVDNLSDALMMDQGPAKRPGRTETPETPRLPAPTLQAGETRDALLAEHGFSCLVTVVKDGREHRVLFDTGLTPDGMVENMRRLEISPADVEAVVLSHGHADHTTGLSGLVRVLGRPGLPVIIHPEFWTHRRIAIPGRDPFEIPSTSRSALVGAGFEIVEDRAPSFLLHRSILVTGEVDRTTSFEQGFAVHQALRDGSWEPDPLILDDQALVVHVRDRGLVVLTGCGHAGIVNIVFYARRLTGVEALYAVIGGFHLNGPLFEPIIGQTCDGLLALGPQYLVPAHCTGWRAQHALAARFGDAYIPNTVGTRFEL